MFAKKYCYFLFHAGDNLHRVVLCANQYATDHVNGGGCLILFVFILLHIAHLSTFSQYVYIGACAKFAHFAPCKAKPLIISKEDVDLYLSLSLAFCSSGFLSCQSLHSLQSEYIGAVYKICTLCRVQGALCKAHCACKAMPLIILKGRDCTALAPAPDWPTSISGMHKWLTGG